MTLKFGKKKHFANLKRFIQAGKLFEIRQTMKEVNICLKLI